MDDFAWLVGFLEGEGSFYVSPPRELDNARTWIVKATGVDRGYYRTSRNHYGMRNIRTLLQWSQEKWRTGTTDICRYSYWPSQRCDTMPKVIPLHESAAADTDR